MTSFHVRHDFNPSVARDALLLLRLSEVPDEATLLQQARERDLDIGRRQSAGKVLATLRDLGFVERARTPSGGSLALTPAGRKVADVAVRDELLLAEFVHLRYWLLWNPDTSAGERFAWSYQTVAGLLWEQAPVSIDNNYLVSTVLSLAEQQFGESGISFSTSSVLGVLYWLRHLSPPCIVSEHTFQRRPGCSPEALLIALQGEYAKTGTSFGIPLRLDAATRNRVCRTVLLDIEMFDEVLAQAEEAFGIVRRHGDGGDMVFIREPFFPELIPQRSDL
jgi:hypothetical protein